MRVVRLLVKHLSSFITFIVIIKSDNGFEKCLMYAQVRIFSTLMYENRYLTIYPEINKHDKDGGFQLTVSFTRVG